MIDVTVFLEPRYHPQVGVFHSTVELRALGCGRNDHLSILCVSEDAAEALADAFRGGRRHSPRGKAVRCLVSHVVGDERLGFFKRGVF